MTPGRYSPVRGRPRLLDVMCGSGGAAKGYDDAGFEVVGVDIEPQPDFPFEFIRVDALVALRVLLRGEKLGRWALADFAGFHASPPCPVHSSLNGWSGDSISPDLVPPTRDLLKATGLPYVIENVPGAPLVEPVRLCGASFGLGVEIDGAWRELRRHRLFETSFPVMVSPCHHTGPPVIVVGGSIGRKVFDPRRKAVAPTFEQAKEAMGMPWVTTRQGVVNAIPPAYTEHVGSFLLAHLDAERSAAA